MENQQIVNALWEAYKAASIDVSGAFSEQDEPAFRKRFDKWLEENYPQLLEVHKPRTIYYHSYGCRANQFIPHGMNDCTCNGEGDPTKEDCWDGDSSHSE